MRGIMPVMSSRPRQDHRDLLARVTDAQALPADLGKLRAGYRKISRACSCPDRRHRLKVAEQTLGQLADLLQKAAAAQQSADLSLDMATDLIMQIEHRREQLDWAVESLADCACCKPAETPADGQAPAS